MPSGHRILYRAAWFLRRFQDRWRVQCGLEAERQRVHLSCPRVLTRGLRDDREFIRPIVRNDKRRDIAPGRWFDS